MRGSGNPCSHQPHSWWLHPHSPRGETLFPPTCIPAHLCTPPPPIPALPVSLSGPESSALPPASLFTANCQVRRIPSRKLAYITLPAPLLPDSSRLQDALEMLFLKHQGLTFFFNLLKTPQAFSAQISAAVGDTCWSLWRADLIGKVQGMESRDYRLVLAHTIILWSLNYKICHSPPNKLSDSWSLHPNRNVS